MTIIDNMRPAPAVTQSSEFDRTPPQDLAAEQGVLGGMLLSKDAIADVVEVLRVGDFYRPAHATIFDVILDLYGRGEPADPVTLSAALGDRGDLARIGGAPYLHTLISLVPTAANAAYYARIVAERAVLRRLVEAGTRIVQLGYGAARAGDGDVDDVVDRAQQAVYDVTDRRTSEDYTPLADLLQPAMDEIETIGAHGGVMSGVPTGFADLDNLTNGLHPGQLVIVAARPGLGKALALDTPLPTPNGWTTMSAVKAGDQLLGADGKPTTVTNAFEVMHGRPCYEVEFSDGSVIVADADHLWKTTTRASRRQRTENKRTLQWSVTARVAATTAHKEAIMSPDQLITYGEAVEFAGEQFRNILHPVLAEVGPVGKVFRQNERLARRAWRGHSRQTVMAVLSRRVNRLMNSQTMAAPNEPITTTQIAETLRHPTDSRLNHAVENTRSLLLPHRDDLPIPPYTLGAWLGDGHSMCAQITTADPEMIMYLEADGLAVRVAAGPIAYAIKVPELPPVRDRECIVCDVRFTPRGPAVLTCGKSCGGKSRNQDNPVYRVGCASCGKVTDGSWTGSRRCAPCHARYGSFVGYLRAGGVYGDKHIPTAYLRASEAQRRALLAGLMDTDGTVTPSGSLQFSVTNSRLADDVRELIVSLGYRCSMTTKRVKGRTEGSSTAYTLNFSTADEVFRLERKKISHKGRCLTKNTTRTGCRYIVAVRPIPSVPVRCVTVDNADHLYLAGRSMVPTHNSTMALDVVRSASIKHNLPSAIFSLEMSKIEITMRLLSAEAKVPLHHLRSGRLSEDEWTKLARRIGEVSEAPLFIDDSPNMTMMEVRAKARRLKQRHDLRVIVLDYLQLMSSAKRVESRQQEVAELSRGLKLLAKELNVPVIAVSQLNRGPEQRTDKRPQLSDLRESGSIEQDSDVVILLHRDDYYEKESARAGEADFIVAKHRNGPTDVITVAFQGHFSRFVDMSVGG